MSLEVAMAISKTILSTKSAMSDLVSKGNTYNLLGPGNVDVRGNETADELVKLGSTLYRS